MFLSTARILLFACCDGRAGFAGPGAADRFDQRQGRRTGGGVLPGVTVEARSDVLPGPRDTVTGAAGEYRLPALPPGNYTVTFTLSGMQTVTRKAQVQLSQDTVVDAALGVQGVTESVTVTGDGLADRQGVGGDQERALERADRGAAGRPGVPRPGEADSRRAVHAGHDARPERRRQRPGQRLPVRRRQRHAAAVRHAVGRARVARHRPGHGRQGRRARGRLRSLRRLLDRLGQQVGHEPLHRPGQLPVPDRAAWPPTSTSGSAVALPAGSQLDRPSTSAGR